MPSTTDMSRLNIVVDPAFSEGDALLGIVASSGFEGASLLPGREAISVLQESDAINERAHYLLIYPDPAEELACAEAAAAENALDTIRERFDQLLSIFRSQRAQVTLINGHAALANPSGLLTELSARLSVDLQYAGAQPVEVVFASTPERYVVACYALQSLDALREIEVSSLALGAARIVDALALPEGGAFKDDLDFQIAENARLLEQHDVVRDDLDCQIAENARLLEQLDSATNDLDFQIAENARLLEQLHAIQEQLEHVSLERSNTSDQSEEVAMIQARHKRELAAKNVEIAGVKQLREALRDRERDIENLHNSQSWKITAPLRWGLRVIGGGK